VLVPVLVLAELLAVVLGLVLALVLGLVLVLGPGPVTGLVLAQHRLPELIRHPR